MLLCPHHHCRPYPQLLSTLCLCLQLLLQQRQLPRLAPCQCQLLFCALSLLPGSCQLLLQVVAVRFCCCQASLRLLQRSTGSLQEERRRLNIKIGQAMCPHPEVACCTTMLTLAAVRPPADCCHDKNKQGCPVSYCLEGICYTDLGVLGRILCITLSFAAVQQRTQTNSANPASMLWH